MRPPLAGQGGCPEQARLDCQDIVARHVAAWIAPVRIRYWIMPSAMRQRYRVTTSSTIESPESIVQDRFTFVMETSPPQSFLPLEKALITPPSEPEPLPRCGALVLHLHIPRLPS